MYNRLLLIDWRFMAMACRKFEKPKVNYRRGLWSPEEDEKLRAYMLHHGQCSWSSVPAKAGKTLQLQCLQSCRQCQHWNHFNHQRKDTFSFFNQHFPEGWWLEESKDVHYIFLRKFWSCIIGFVGLQRNGKSCRLRWLNYLRPGLKRGGLSSQEVETLVKLNSMLGNK